MILPRSIAFVLLSASVATTLHAAPSLEQIEVRKIWDAGAHNAFTDLIRFKDQWFCSFREGDDHVGGDGKLRVLTSTDGQQWTSAALLTEEGIDLRDPKLSITSDGRLMMVAGGSVYRGTKTLHGRRPRVAFSTDGRTWTTPQAVVNEGDWLWRVTWHKGRAYGVVYSLVPPQPKGTDKPNSAEWSLRMVESEDGLTWRDVADLEVPGRPNETTIRFQEDGTCIALVRREGTKDHPDKHAWIGTSKPPYKEWSWKDAGQHIGGPNFIILPDGQMIAGGRTHADPKGPRTAIGALTKESYKPQLTFVSSGDNSYPGFVWHGGDLWVSYYSSHEGKTNIYLAKVKVSQE